MHPAHWPAQRWFDALAVAGFGTAFAKSFKLFLKEDRASQRRPQHSDVAIPLYRDVWRALLKPEGLASAKLLKQLVDEGFLLFLLNCVDRTEIVLTCAVEVASGPGSLVRTTIQEVAVQFIEDLAYLGGHQEDHHLRSVQFDHRFLPLQASPVRLSFSFRIRIIN